MKIRYATIVTSLLAAVLCQGLSMPARAGHGCDTTQDAFPTPLVIGHYRLGVDGLFSDFADTAVAARVLFELESNPDGSRCLIGDRHGPNPFRPDCVTR